MLEFPRWKVDVTVDGDVVKTFYEIATTAAAAIAKAKYKMRGAVSSAGAFRFKASRADAATHHATKYGKKTSEKVARTMREFKEGKLRSGSGGKVTSREQAIAIGLSQARARGYKVPPAPSHSTMLRGVPLERVEAVTMPTGAAAEIHIHRGKGGYAGVLVLANGNELPLSLGVPVPKTAAEALLGAKKFLATVWGKTGKAKASHSTKASTALFAVEIDPHEFEGRRDLPGDAAWRGDLKHLAEAELARGRTHRRPKDARYDVIEWAGYRGAVGRLLDWLEAAPGVTRYAEIHQ